MARNRGATIPNDTTPRALVSPCNGTPLAPATDTADQRLWRQRRCASRRDPPPQGGGISWRQSTRPSHARRRQPVITAGVAGCGGGQRGQTRRLGNRWLDDGRGTVLRTYWCQPEVNSLTLLVTSGGGQNQMSALRLCDECTERIQNALTYSDDHGCWFFNRRMLDVLQKRYSQYCRNPRL